MMRLLVLTLAVGLATAATVSANGAPVRPNLKDQDGSNIVQVAGGCGPGFHRDYAGACIQNYYGTYPNPYDRPYGYQPNYPPYYQPYRGYEPYQDYRTYRGYGPYQDY